MVSFYCNKKTCKDGNCEGCKNHKKWCDDPRCFPHCRGCELPDDHEKSANIIVWTIILLLVFIFVILFIGYGPRLVEARKNNIPVNHQYDWFSEKGEIK